MSLHEIGLQTAAKQETDKESVINNMVNEIEKDDGRKRLVKMQRHLGKLFRKSITDFIFGEHKHRFYYFGEMSGLVKHLFDTRDSLQLAQLYLE